MVNWINGLFSLVAEPLKGWQQRKTVKLEQRFELDKLEHEAKIKKANAMVKLAEKAQINDFDLDKIALENMKNSWKDELVLVIFLTPMILAFVPDYAEYALAGFKIIEQMPSWYTAIIIGMVIVIYGLRGLLKTYLERKKPLIKK